jgi:hypothetical protein
MTPAAILARCLEQQAAADSRAALDYATGCSVGTVLALYAAGLLSDAECDAGTAAAREADRARRLAWDTARAAALGACSWPATAHHASPADLLAVRLQRIEQANGTHAVIFTHGAAAGAAEALEDAGLIPTALHLEYLAHAEGTAEERRAALEAAHAAAFAADSAPAGAHSCPQTAHNPATNAPLSAVSDHFPGPENEHHPTHAEGTGEPRAGLEAPADAGAYVVTGEADESGQRLYVAGPFASYAEADELAAALQDDSDQWADDDPLLCTSHVRYRVERLADQQDAEQPDHPQDAAPASEPQAWGFLGLAYCLADCLGDSASNPPTLAERAMLRGMAASALRAWQAVHAAHGDELASLHAAARHAEQVGAHSIGAVSVELLRLLIGEGVRHD